MSQHPLSTQFQNFHYLFPIQTLQIKHINNKQHFKLLIKQQAHQTNYHKYWSIKQINIKRKNGTFTSLINISCRKCKARINYKKINDFWQLNKFDNNHNHSSQINSAYSILQQQKILKNLNFSDKNFYENMRKSYKITRNRLFKKKKTLLKKVSFQTIKALLQSLKYRYKYKTNNKFEDYEGYPSILVCVSQQHKQNYKLYGQTIIYDIEYKCVKQCNSDGKRFCVGLFSGFDNNNRVLLFGLSVHIEESTEIYKQIFEYFLMLMGENRVSCIITSQNKYIVGGLQRLRQQQGYSFHNILDRQKYIKKLKEMEREIDNDQILNRLIKVMKEYDYKVGQHYLKQFKQILDQQKLSHIYPKIISQLNKICVWSMPKQFIGLLLYSLQNIHQILNLKFSYQFTIYQLIQTIYKITLQKNNHHKTYTKAQYQQIFHDHQLKQLRTKYQNQPINQFIYFYNRSQFYRTIYSHQSYYQVAHIIDFDSYVITSNNCQCGTYQKIGIPCQHLIYICREQNNGLRYSDLMNKRWQPRYK